MLRNFMAIAVIFFISACSMPETKIYNLDIPVEQGSPRSTADDFLVIRIDAPRYLAQPYIAYRSSPYQMLISRYSKWDSNPKVMVSEGIRDSLFSTGLFREVKILNIAPKGFYLLDINLKRFERLDEGNKSFGELVLDVVFITPESKELYRGRISKKVKLDDQSFLSLAKGLSIALNEAIEEVEDNITKVLLE
jgi:ABC-type uncharacterized transport system auxiliary subunit